MVLPSVADAVVYATAVGAASGVWALRRWLPLPHRVPADPAEQAAFATLHPIARAAKPPLAGTTNHPARPRRRRAVGAHRTRPVYTPGTADHAD
ncbi:hypothetical protein, partial [Actinomadura sp. BRA 177]|uniref:hypothetical protein n=1 Tax=Actinomadura sp. BRA 177 TaxID=2745202 RepID=UPI0015959873